MKEMTKEEKQALEEVVRRLRESALETIKKSGLIFWRRAN